MKTQLNEIERMQQLAGLLNEAFIDDKGNLQDFNDDDSFQISIEEGYIKNKNTKAYFVQILHNDEDGDMLDVDEFSDLAYLNNLGAGVWTIEPLKQYNGNEYDSIGERYNVFEFDTANEVEDFMKNNLKDVLQDGF